MTAAALPNRTFGIELEVIRPRNLSMAGLAAAITAAGVTCYEERYGHSTPSNWKIVTDASLEGNGCEIVSPVLRGEDGIQQARMVADAAAAVGCKVNVSCGFHIHVGAADLNPEQVKKVAINFVWFETFFDHILPESRRATTNRYIRSNRARFGGYGTDAVNRAVARISAANNDMTSVIDAVIGGDRYHKLNLTALYRHRTIEFRHHSGTVEADKIEHWIRLAVCFVEKSRVSKPRARTVTRDLRPAEEMHRFFAMFDLPAETRRFYMARRAELAKASAEAAAQRARMLADIGGEAARAVTAMQARYDRVMSFQRPWRSVGYNIRNAISNLTHMVNHPATYDAERVANYIADCRRRNLMGA